MRYGNVLARTYDVLLKDVACLANVLKYTNTFLDLRLIWFLASTNVHRGSIIHMMSERL